MIVWVLCLELRTQVKSRERSILSVIILFYPQPTSLFSFLSVFFFHPFYLRRNSLNARFQIQIKPRSSVRCQTCDGSSDVFTLFVVFLFMNSLERTTNALTFLPLSQIRTSEHVNSSQAESLCFCVCVYVFN